MRASPSTQTTLIAGGEGCSLIFFTFFAELALWFPCAPNWRINVEFPLATHPFVPLWALWMPRTLLICLECNSIGKGFFGFLCFMLGWILRTWLVGKLCKLQASCSPHICLTLSLRGFFNCFPLELVTSCIFSVVQKNCLANPALLICSYEHLVPWTITCRTSACRGVFTHAIDTCYEVSPICASA